MKKTFNTGLQIQLNEHGQPNPPFKGAGFVIDIIESKIDYESISKIAEVIINCNSWSRAQRTLNLILSSVLLYDGDPPLFEHDLLAYNNIEPEFSNPEYRQVMVGRKMRMPNIPIACKIAAKVSRNLKWVYAITKYKFSSSLYGLFHVDLEPFSSPHHKVSNFPYDHVIFSHAIISAYSAIEDLGLEVRASHDKPSRIKGVWNPVVKNNLEDRLLLNNINLNEKILWTIRGPIRKIEMKRKLPLQKKASWSWGPVRDSEIEIIDAIAYADWLRDCVASHGVKDLTRVLSPYDVINVQHLTRRLLLETIGYWRYEKIKLIITMTSCKI